MANIEKKPFEERETFSHRFAKNLLAKWLREEEAKNDHCKIEPFEWRRNYGVFTELRFHNKDEFYYFEQSDTLEAHLGFDDKGVDKRGRNPLDWFKDGVDRGKILFVPDITIFHKGTPKILIEVVHSNPVSDEKLEAIHKWYDGEYFELYEVFSSWILEQTERPNILLSRKLV